MNIHATCRAVNASAGKDGPVMEIIVGVEPEVEDLPDLGALDGPTLAAVREVLRAPGRPPAPPDEKSPDRARVLVVRPDGAEITLDASIVEVLDLSVGGQLYWLHAVGEPAAWQWMVGRSLRLARDPGGVLLTPARSA